MTEIKTELVPWRQLNPGDKLFIDWPQKPIWHKLPDILTIRSINNDGSINICESGGINLKPAEKFLRVIGAPSPEPGDTITFFISGKNEIGYGIEKEHQAMVNEIWFDELKKEEPKCIVIVENQEHRIAFSKVKRIDKTTSEVKKYN